MQRSKSARPAQSPFALSGALSGRSIASLSQAALLAASFLFVVAMVAGAI